MATLKVYRLDRTENGTVDFNEKIANAQFNPFIIKDAVVHYLAKLRSGNHKVKGRSEVAGSNRKLFKQKGTGRARAGSKKPPHWRQGGISMGPVVRDHSISLNKKVLKNALSSAIAEKIRNNELTVVDSLALTESKTKNFKQTLKGLNMNSVLVVFSEADENLVLASRNLQNVKVVHSSGVNVYDVMYYNQVLISTAAIKEIEERLI